MGRLDPLQRRIDDPRLPVCVPVTIETAVRSGLPEPGRIVDLSRGGLALRLFGALAPGCPVHVTLHLGGGSALMCGGRVAWVDRSIASGEWAAGVTFADELTGDLVADIASDFPPREQ